MNKITEELKPFYVWINHTDKIVSFNEAEGFEKICFPSYKEMLSFAFNHSYVGYRVQ